MKAAELIRKIIKEVLGDDMGYPEVYGRAGDYGARVTTSDGNFQLTFAKLELLSRRLLTSTIDIAGKAEVRWSEDTYEGAETSVTISDIPFED